MRHRKHMSRPDAPIVAQLIAAHAVADRTSDVVSHRKRRNADHPYFVESFQSQGVSA